MNKPFVMVRKPNKLPGEKFTQKYGLEYGTDSIEVHKDALQAGERVLVVDDLLATGGTAGAAVSLIEAAGAKVAACGFIVELPELKGREKLAPHPVFALVDY